MRVLPVFLAAISFALLGCGGESPGQRSPKTFTISNGDSVTYKPGVARPGDKIVCVGGGGVVIGKPGTGSGSFGTGPGGSADVSVSTGEDGSVVASCKIW
jgi:hypothetical protein